jgi:oligopeptide/dipeptide ABC transporter ATP-binding protein
MQMVFQEAHASLNPRLRVASIVEDPLRFGPPLRKEGRRERVVEVLSEVGLNAGYLERYPHQLTGSEAQRVGIARAIVTSPDLVILDEPTSYLDISARAEIIDLLRTLQKQLGVTYLFISHDLTAVHAIADRVAVMYLGKIVETGATEEMFSSQRHPYTRALLSATLFPDPTRRIPRFQLSGEIPSPMNLPKHCFLAGRCPLVIDRCWEQIPPLEEVEPGRMAACLRWEDVASARDSTAQGQSTHSEMSRQAARGGNN